MGAPLLTCAFSSDFIHRTVSWDEPWDECTYGASVRSRPRRRRGYIEALPSGSFRAVVYAGTDPLTRDDIRLRETCRTRVEAEKALTRLQGQVDDNRHPKSSITVATAVEQWMEVADLEVTTRERYEDLIRLYTVPTFGDLQAGRLDAELLERFYARLHRCKAMCGGRPPRGHVCTPLSTSTTRKIHYVLRGALGQAARWGYVSVNAAELAQAPSPRKPRWRHVDLDRANLWVERSTAHSRTGLVDKDTKTDNQRRPSLDPHTVELLRTHRDTVTEQLAVLGVPLDGETYVFSTTPDYSQPRSPKGVTQKYRKMAMRLRLHSPACTAALLPDRASPPALPPPAQARAQPSASPSSSW